MVLTDLIIQFTSIIKEIFPAKITMVQTLVTEVPIPVTVVRTLVTMATPVQQLIPVIPVARKILVTLHQTTILIENVNYFKAVFSFLSIS